MPRRSSADLSIVPLIPGKGRPEPPRALDPIEARAFRDVVDAMPGQWLDAAASLILRRTVTQIAIAERIEARLRRLARLEDEPEALAAEAALAVHHREAARAVILGLTALRATPRSRMAPREGLSRFERGASSRPWEIVARKADDGSAS